MSDPFDELKSEVENSLTQLQQLISRAEKESKLSPASKDTIDELLLSLQATREDADLLRSACRSLRRRIDDSSSRFVVSDDIFGDNDNENNNKNNKSKDVIALEAREKFCEKTDAELDRIQLVIEDMQRQRMKNSGFGITTSGDNSSSKNKNSTHQPNRNDDDGDIVMNSLYGVGQQTKKSNNNNFDPNKPSSAAVGNKNDDDDDDARQTNESQTKNLHHGTNPTISIVDNRNWDRESAMRKIKMRQKRREEEEDKTLADLEPKHDGTWQGMAKYYFEQFQAWAIDFVDNLTPQQRIGWMVGMVFVVVFLMFALFHNRKE